MPRAQSIDRVILSIIAICAVQVGFAQQIGTVATNEPTLRGTPPGKVVRELRIGTSIEANELISSSASGRGQLLFLDQTTLSIGPNTSILLDKFVFDPTGGQGDFALKLTQGTLRFIGGTISQTKSVTITTPTATIGIRGSLALVEFENDQTRAIFLAGDEMCINSNQVQVPVCTSRQGGILSDSGYAGSVDQGSLFEILNEIDGPPVAMTGGGGNVSDILNRNVEYKTTVSPNGKRFDDELFEDAANFEDIVEALSQSIMDSLDVPGPDNLPVPSDDPNEPPDPRPIGCDEADWSSVCDSAKPPLD